MRNLLRPLRLRRQDLIQEHGLRVTPDVRIARDASNIHSFRRVFSKIGKLLLPSLIPDILVPICNDDLRGAVVLAAAISVLHQASIADCSVWIPQMRELRSLFTSMIWAIKGSLSYPLHTSKVLSYLIIRRYIKLVKKEACLLFNILVDI